MTPDDQDWKALSLILIGFDVLMFAILLVCWVMKYYG